MQANDLTIQLQSGKRNNDKDVDKDAQLRDLEKLHKEQQDRLQQLMQQQWELQQQQLQLQQQGHNGEGAPQHVKTGYVEQEELGAVEAQVCLFLCRCMCMYV